MNLATLIVAYYVDYNLLETMMLLVKQVISKESQ
jgi:hypothetical protein